VRRPADPGAILGVALCLRTVAPAVMQGRFAPVRGEVCPASRSPAVMIRTTASERQHRAEGSADRGAGPAQPTVATCTGHPHGVSLDRGEQGPSKPNLNLLLEQQHVAGDGVTV
jgi:hypothetical protein